MIDLNEIINLLNNAQSLLALAMKERDPNAFPVWRLREALRHAGIASWYIKKNDNEESEGE